MQIFKRFCNSASQRIAVCFLIMTAFCRTIPFILKTTQVEPNLSTAACAVVHITKCSVSQSKQPRLMQAKR